MCTEGKDNLHILVRHTELIYFVDEYGHKVKTVGHAGQVVADKRDGVAGLDDLVDWFHADGG